MIKYILESRLNNPLHILFMSNFTKKKHLLTYGVGIFATLILGAFMVSRIAPLVRGSAITLDHIPDQELTNPKIVLSGKTFDTKQLSMNGTPITLSPTGNFEQTIILHPGYNMITLDGTDTLHKTKKHTYTFILKENDTGTFAVSTLPLQQ